MPCLVLCSMTDYIDCSGECYVLAMVHINRIHMARPDIAIDSLTIHRMLLTACALRSSL